MLKPKSRRRLLRPAYRMNWGLSGLMLVIIVLVLSTHASAAIGV